MSGRDESRQAGRHSLMVQSTMVEKQDSTSWFALHPEAGGRETDGCSRQVHFLLFTLSGPAAHRMIVPAIGGGFSHLNSH